MAAAIQTENDHPAGPSDDVGYIVTARHTGEERSPGKKERLVLQSALIRTEQRSNIMSENEFVATMEQARRPRPIRFLIPLAILIVLGWVFGVGLTVDPRELPSPLIGKPVPIFMLAPVEGRVDGLSSEHLNGEVSLVNVFASWCTACRDEHPLLMRLQEENIIPIYGLNYRDRPEDAAAWLDALGDPYARTGADINGRVGIDWGVYGVPETYVIDRHGQIAYKHIGAIDTRVLNETLLPLIKDLREQP